MEKNEKKRLILFLAIAYGMTIVLNVFLYFGLQAGKDTSLFVSTQMTMPACGVILGLLLYARDKEMPKAFFISYIAFSAIMVIVSIISLFVNPTMVKTASGEQSLLSIWFLYILYAASVVVYILSWVCGKKKRANAGLSHNKLGLSIGLLIVFFIAFVVRFYISGALSENSTDLIATYNDIFTNIYYWRAVAIIAVSVFLGFFTVLGEEYGWRYYLQPILQNKFGKRLGVIILGVVWGLWHAGLDFMFYTKDSGPQLLVNQIAACIALAIFFGYVYMKTNNIWLVTLMHFLWDGMMQMTATLLSEDGSGITNMSLKWSEIPSAVICNLVLCVFIFAPIYNKKKQEVLQAEVTE